VTQQIFLEVDASQIEARIELMLTRDAKMLELARARPTELDMHTRNAALIFRMDEAALTAELKSSDAKVKAAAKEKRYLGKKTGHAAMRGMGAKRFAETLLLEDVVRTIPECDEMLKGWMRAHAPIDDYFADCRRVVSQSRALVSTWGDIWRCTYDRFDEVLWGKVYSWLPQTECARQMNHWGFEPMFAYLAAEKPWAHINLPVHDSLLTSCRPNDAYDIAAFIKATFERARYYFGEPLTVPVTFKLGENWAGRYEFDDLPSRAEFTAAADDCQRRAIAAAKEAA
jgi:DNA polymerase I-like protein with 3'-5' exonuclease and polymerase domains